VPETRINAAKVEGNQIHTLPRSLPHRPNRWVEKNWCWPHGPSIVEWLQLPGVEKQEPEGRTLQTGPRQKMEETAKETARKQGPAAKYPTQPTPPPAPKAEDWAEKNEWFGKDNAMTYTAFDLHRKLTEEEGFDPKSDSYYEEIDKRIKLEFPHKFGKVEQQISKPTQNVASATRSSKTSRKSVRLTPSQVAIAKKLRVPLEEYARQLKLTEGE